MDIDAFANNVNWNSPKNLIIDKIPVIPTIVKDTGGTVLGLVYSSKDSLYQAITQKSGIYYSRSRGLWIKSPSGINGQRLLNIEVDCDGDALLFTVKQRGVFCHTGSLSCFSGSTSLDLTMKSEEIIIGYSYGRSEIDIMNLFALVGIHVYKNTKPRSGDFSIKSHLYDNIKLIGCKPKDIATLLTRGIIHMGVCFVDSVGDLPTIKSLYPQTPKTVKIVLISRADAVINDMNQIKILTEYPELTQRYTKEKFPQAEIIHVHGNTEQLIKDGYGDLGVVVCDSGQTIIQNNLIIVDTISRSKLGFFFSETIYKQYPRFFRELANALSNDTIYFYSVDGPFGFLSNFYPCDFKDDKEREWKSSEHYYQAHKFTDPELFELIRSQPTPKLCYRTAYANSSKFRSDWLSVKDSFMWEALMYKFGQNPDLKQSLIDTDPNKLVEHALQDYHYGCGVDGTGKNTLGRLLMDLRTVYTYKYKSKSK